MNYFIYKHLFNYTIIFPDIKLNGNYFISDSFKFPVKFISDLGHPDKDYIIVYAKFKKKYLNLFIEEMSKAEQRAMILNIYDQYRNAVLDFAKIVEE